MTKKKVQIVNQNYPTPPVGATKEELVEEYFIYYDDTKYPKHVLVGTVYCPKTPVVNGAALFDPTTTAAKAALEKYKKQIENRKRYDKDIKRRRREHQPDS